MTDPLGPRNFEGILSDTFSIYGKNFLRLIVIVVIVELILGIIGFILINTLMLPVALTEFSILDPLALLIPAVLISLVILAVASVITAPLMQGALIHAISTQTLGQEISIEQSYRFAWKRLGSLIGATILAGLALFFLIATIIGIPIAIYLGIRWVFVLPSILLEGVSPLDAFSRSSQLVEENWWRVLGITLFMLLISAVISSILGFIPVVGAIIGGILSTPVAIISTTLLYYDLRVRKENYSLQKLELELNGSTTGTPTRN